MNIAKEDIIISKIDYLQQQLDKVEKEHKPNRKRVMSIIELSKLYNIGGKRIRRAIEDGELSYVSLNKRDISIFQGEFENWLESKKRNARRKITTFDSSTQLLKSKEYL